MPVEEDLKHLRRCVELARQALQAGDEPFGSVLVDAEGQVLMRTTTVSRAAIAPGTRVRARPLGRGEHDAGRACCATVYTSVSIAPCAPLPTAG